MRSRKTSAAALAVALVLVVALTAVLATNAPRERPIASASGLTIRDNGVVTAYQEGVWDSSGELKPDPQTGHYYTKEQYEQVAALKTEGYESLSIAEFNRPPTYTATRWRWVGPRQATPSPTGFWTRMG